MWGVVDAGSGLIIAGRLLLETLPDQVLPTVSACQNDCWREYRNDWTNVSFRSDEKSQGRQTLAFR
jgi:hypothetical protein